MTAAARRAQSAARSQARRERNAQRLIAGTNGRPYAAHIPLEQHGTESTYVNHCCRCDPCFEASGAAHRARE